jgi:hypothetical protein
MVDLFLIPMALINVKETLLYQYMQQLYNSSFIFQRHIRRPVDDKIGRNM